jgi:DNA repair protein RecO (recombination protein O)
MTDEALDVTRQATLKTVLPEALSEASEAKITEVGADVNVRLSAAEVLPRAPMLQRPAARVVNSLIADAYAVHTQQTVAPARSRQSAASIEKPFKKRVAASADATLAKKPALKAKPAADEFDLAFILHAYPYKETSLILETFTRKHGRVAMVARGAKRPHGALTSARSPFQPLNLVWMGKSDLKTLKTAESGAIFPQLQGTALLSAFYLNELILKLCAKEDPQPALFDAYQVTLQRLIEGHYRGQITAHSAVSPSGKVMNANDAGKSDPFAAEFAAQASPEFAHYAAHLKQKKRLARANQMQQIAVTLRQFELTLFQHLGYGLNLDIAAHTGLPIQADAQYCYIADQGACYLADQGACYIADQGAIALAETDTNTAASTAKPAHGLQLCGKTLLDMAQANYQDPVTQQQSKQLVRLIINHLLGSQVLHTRSLIAEFSEIK